MFKNTSGKLPNLHWEQFCSYHVQKIATSNNYTHATTCRTRRRPVRNRHSSTSLYVRIFLLSTTVLYTCLCLYDPQYRTFYVGQTSRSVAARLQEHSQGTGASFTSPMYRRPIAVGAFVHGFTDSEQRLHFEALVHRSLYHANAPSFDDVTNDMHALAVNENLLFVKCGSIGIRWVCDTAVLSLSRHRCYRKQKQTLNDVPLCDIIIL